ncbi:unnamed protein product [Thlaspi arvense]|uniref:Polygalacturonase n=1 Tax=Thlaspi arvense TaxID=13288 RepID=A0AAU9TCT2_THLAR|nr:unnamed protein product [Thlaspi arvense]
MDGHMQCQKRQALAAQRRRLEFSVQEERQEPPWRQQQLPPRQCWKTEVQGFVTTASPATRRGQGSPKKGYGKKPSSVFNVLDFGAKGNGASDDTKPLDHDGKNFLHVLGKKEKHKRMQKVSWVTIEPVYDEGYYGQIRLALSHKDSTTNLLAIATSINNEQISVIEICRTIKQKEASKGKKQQNFQNAGQQNPTEAHPIDSCMGQFGKDSKLNNNCLLFCTNSPSAFQAAWASACKVEASTILVPPGYKFLVGPISFSGPYCQPDIVFQLDGSIIAPTDSKAWGSVQGTGTIDGRGSVWWQDSPYDDPIDDESKLIIPLNRTFKENSPTPALRFYGSFNATVTGITIQNSPQCHLKFDNCFGVSVFNINVSSPGDSPNTDGIHLQNSKDVIIRSSNLACGDDCVSIQTGCTNVYIHNVNCGPGHGISIGSLGKDATKACVANITVRDVNMHNTMNGVKITAASLVTWHFGIMHYTFKPKKPRSHSQVESSFRQDNFGNSRALTLENRITYEKIRGTYTVKPVHLACSDNLPCVDVTLTDIELKPLQEQYHLYNVFCWHTFGQLNSPTVPPIDCLHVGKPSNNWIQTNRDTWLHGYCISLKHCQ